LVLENASAEDIWRPNPKFSIEGSSYVETLTFVSGFAYALSYSDRKLRSSNLPNYYCIPENEHIDSKLLIDIGNEKLQGDNTSESVAMTITEGLADRYPCEK
jgi:hypothetical protein